MASRRFFRSSAWCRVLCLLALLATAGSVAAKPRAPENLFGNASFEDGRNMWQLDRNGKTAAQFAVDDKDAAAGQRSALIGVDAVDGWGIQFGQSMEAPAVGKTYTFSVLAKSVKQPVAVRLEIERRGQPYDRAASQQGTIAADAWTELHVTFKIEKPYPEGWFAYVSCKQPNVQFRLDGFRLCEGQYVPYEKASQKDAQAAAVALFDTGVPSPSALTGDAMTKRAGWTKLGEDDDQHRFTGDAVAMNDRLALVLRRGAAGAELYGLGGSAPVLRAALAPSAAAPAGKLTKISLIDNTPAETTIEANFDSTDGKTLTVRFELGMGQPFVKTEPRDATTALNVEAPCRFAVLPDFFADDIVVDANQIPVEQAELPSENFLLHLLPDTNGIVMAVSSRRDRDARIELSGVAGDERRIRSSQWFYGTGGKIWVAALEGRGIWNCRDVRKEDAGKILPMEWTAPWPAQWRVDWRVAGGLTASWEMIAQVRSGEYVKHGWFGNADRVPADRKRWTTVLGSFLYPCWIDRDGRGHLQPLGRLEQFQGPTLVYPINRVRETPLDEFTMVDVVRATLGVGPCEYILDVEGQGTARKGRATCATRDLLKPIYAAKQQKQKRAEIEQALVEVVIFVKHIRGRIETYVQFGHDMLAYLAAQKKAHPELADFLAEMETSTKAIDAAVVKRKAAIKDLQYVPGLTEEFRKKLLDYEGDDALKECTRITHAIVDAGGNQDELVGECRNAVKVLRQRAGLAMATNPQAAEIAREIRDRTQKVLRNATSYEAPRH